MVAQRDDSTTAEKGLMISCLMLYLVAFAGLAWACLEMFRREMRDRIILTPFVLYCGNEVVRVWPAGIYARWAGISEDLFVSLVLISSTFAFLAGYALFRFFAGKNTIFPLAFWKKPMTPVDSAGHLTAIVGCAALLIAGGLYFYRGIPPGVFGLFRLLTEGFSAHIADFAAEQRLLLTKGHHFGGEYRGQGLFRVTLFLGWPMLTATAFLIQMQKRSRLWLAIALFCLAACVIYVGGDGTRGPVVWALVSVAVILSLETRVRLRTVAMICGVLFVLVFGLSAAKKFAGAHNRGQLLEEGVQRLAERVFVGNGINTVYVMELMRVRQLEMRYGQIHRTEVVNALPGVSAGVPFAYELFTLVRPEAKESATTLSSMTYLGKLYGDFGWFGCLFGSFTLGVFLALASQYLLSWPKTVLNTTLIGVAFTQLGRMNLIGITPIFSYSVVLMVVAFFYFTLLSFGTLYGRPAYRQLNCARNG